MTMKFDETSYFILYRNPEDDARVEGEMDSISWGFESP